MKLKLFICTFTAVAISASVTQAGIVGAYTIPKLKSVNLPKQDVISTKYKVEKNTYAPQENIDDEEIAEEKSVTQPVNENIMSSDEDGIKCSLDKNRLLTCLGKNGKPYTGRRVVYGAGGNPASIENFKNGYLDGLNTYFSISGQRKERSYYKMGIKNGTHKIYYSDNNIKILTTYKDGVLNGTLDVYLQDGSLKGRMRYKNGYLERGYCKNGKKKEDFSKEMLKSYPYNTIESCGVGL